MGCLETQRELRRNQMIVVAWTGSFLLKTVLQLELRVRCEAIAGRDINTPNIIAPGNTSSISVGHIAEELLVPADRAEKLRSEFVFRFEIINKCVGVADARDFETRFVKFGPELQVMPGEADILAQNAFVVIADITAIRQRPHRFGPEIRAIARGESEVPHLIWPKPDARADGGIIKANFSRIPRFRP